MRKVIGIGETILDIVFRDGKPAAAVPGGSVYNAMVSLGRTGADVVFVSETGNDHVGRIILDNMRSNGIRTDCVHVYAEGKSPVSLAFLNEKSDAEYTFYRDYPRQRLDVRLPDISRDDIVVIGSYFAVNPMLREKVKELLDRARESGALVYYDVNFRSVHANEAIKLLPAILENFEYADVLRGSADDFQNMFRVSEADKVYRSHVAFYCPNFICTDGGNGIALRTACVQKDYAVEPLQAVSTIGAGDNFNAGVIYGLLKHRVRRDDLAGWSETDWDAIIRCGKDFGAEVCKSVDNYISRHFAEEYVRK